MWYLSTSAVMFVLKACVVVAMFGYVEMGEHHNDNVPVPVAYDRGLHYKLAHWYRNGGASSGVFAVDSDLPFGSCSYTGQCSRTVEYTGHFGVPRTRTFNYNCRKTASCETRMSSWTGCTRECGTGYRTRVGRCDGALCNRLLREVEQCNTESCGSGNGGGGPTAGPTTPPPPPPTESNACGSFPCANGGACSTISAAPGYQCDCTGTGYEGSTCTDDINECSSSPCVNGVCQNTPGSFNCDCTGTNFNGALCENALGVCNPNPCNTGSCSDGGAIAVCDCTGTGFEGTNCQTDINECSTGTPCNSGTCTNTPGSFTCDCSGTGFEDPTCSSDINECAAGSPCGTGSCTNSPGTFTCDCTGTGFDGATCGNDINECSTGTPCNTGTCTNTPGTFTCDCTGTGFEDPTCSSDIDECASGSCNGGACTNTPGTFTCDCTGTGFEGSTCSDRDGNWGAWSQWTTTACSASCCGGTQERTRTRSCDNPAQAGSGANCPGIGTETESGIACNEEVCPLSCDPVPVGTIYPDPCGACSNLFYACTGATEPVAFNCPGQEVWNVANNMCEAECSE